MTFLKRQKALASRTSPIKRVGTRTLKYQEFRNEKAERDLNEDDLIECEDWKIGLPRCGYARPAIEMDLHHIHGRDGDLITKNENTVWLTRQCHEKVDD